MTFMASNGAARTPRDSFMTREEFYEMRNELKAQIAAGELDVGDDGPDVEPTGELTKTVASTPKGHGQGSVGDCFKRLCAAFGADVPIGTTRVCDVPEHELRAIRQSGRQFKIYYEHYDEDDKRNHVVAVDCSVNSARVAVTPAGPFSGEFSSKVIGVTSSEQFFNNSNMFARVNFFAETEGLASFGGDLSNVGSPQSRYQRQDRNAPRDQSIVDDRASSGQANVAGGVKRAKRRVVASRSKFSPTGHVAKSYAASPGLMFNNLNEMFQDTVSREYAQEIIEAVFEAWGLPNDEPDALKYGEDLICAFFIATTASNKADFDFVFPIPCHSGEVDAEFSVLSKVLAEQFGVTRRQFARGMADDMRAYIKDPDNTHLRPKLADRAGCDPQMAELAFDGSTHCTGLTSAQLTFTRLLESRNLFEDDAVLSQGTSQTIMEGIHGHVRSKVQR